MGTENNEEKHGTGPLAAPPWAACEELRREAAHLMTEKVKLHAECQKYRVALSRVASPETWGVNPGHHVEIARRALVIGIKVDPLPEAAKISQPNDQAQAPAGSPWRPGNRPPYLSLTVIGVVENKPVLVWFSPSTRCWHDNPAAFGSVPVDWWQYLPDCELREANAPHELPPTKTL